MTMEKLYLLLIPSCVLFLAGCGSSAGIVATIGNEKLTLNEFEESYAKNNGGWDASAKSSLDDRQRFLELLLKFKLKVQEARARGLLRDTSIQNELDSYRLSVAQSYMLDKEIVEPNVKLMYDRKLEDLRASHILIRVAPNATPADTLAAYAKALKVISLISTSGFDSLARTYSEDAGAARNGGDLGFFGVGATVPEFEDACYSLKAGEYSKLPVRSQFGYHVVKVTARRPNEGRVRVSHIVRQFKPTLVDTIAVRDSVWIIFNLIKKGMSFGEAVRKFSEDAGSVGDEGNIGYYERNRLPPALADLLFRTPQDSVTEPFRFDYGYHIFRVTDRQKVQSFSELERDLKAQYQERRYANDYRDYVHNLKKQSNLNFDVVLLYKLARSFDTTKIAGDPHWSDTLAAEVLKKTLFTYNNRTFTVRDFVAKVDAEPEFKTYRLTPSNVESIIERLSEAQVFEEHARRVPERHPPFAALMEEYESGLLLYRIEQDEVWKKLVVNDSLLRGFYQQQKEKYRWPERVNFAEIYVLSDSAAKAAYWQLQYGEDFLRVAEEHTVRTGYRQRKGVWGLVALNSSELAQKASFMAVDSVSPPFPFESGWSILKALARDSARTKTFEEAGPELASGYQELASKQREHEWVEALMKKYPVAINREVLGDAFKRKKVETR